MMNWYKTLYYCAYFISAKDQKDEDVAYEYAYIAIGGVNVMLIAVVMAFFHSIGIEKNNIILFFLLILSFALYLNYTLFLKNKKYLRDSTLYEKYSKPEYKIRRNLIFFGTYIIVGIFSIGGIYLLNN